MKKWIVTGLIIATAFQLWAQIPEMFRYQGRLVDGTNLVNATVPMSFKLYDALSGGGGVLYEDSNSVLVVDGLYSTYIGDNTVYGSLTSAMTNAAVYLELTVNGETLSPRERLVSVPYALNPGSSTLNITQEALDTRYVLLTGSNITSLAAFRDSIGAAYTGNTVRTDGTNITNAPAFRAAIGLASNAQLRISMLGTSITAGYTRENVNPYNYLSWVYSGGYAGWARGYLGCECVIVTNCGISGAGMSIVLSQVPTVVASSADLVLLEVGTNDKSTSAVTFNSNLTTIVSTLLASGKKVVVLTVYPASTDSTNQWLFIKDVNSYIRTLPNIYGNNIAVADVNKLMTCPSNGLSVAQYTSDGLHPNEVGGQLTGRVVADAIKTIIPAARGDSRSWTHAGDKSSGINPAVMCFNTTSGWANDGTNFTTSLVGSTEFFGNTLVLGVTNNYLNSFGLQYSESSQPYITTGYVYQAFADVEYSATEVSAATNCLFQPVIQLEVGKGYPLTNVVVSSFMISQGYRAITAYPASNRFVLSTPKTGVLGNGDYIVRFTLNFYGMKSGYIKIHRLNITKTLP